MYMYDYKIPDYYKYLTWYELKTPLEVYNFIQEMINDGVKLEDYPDINTYYKMLLESAFKENADMVVVDYVVNKLRCALVNYGFANTTFTMDVNTHKRLYFYWNRWKE